MSLNHLPWNIMVRGKAVHHMVARRNAGPGYGYFEQVIVSATAITFCCIRNGDFLLYSCMVCFGTTFAAGAATVFAVGCPAALAAAFALIATHPITFLQRVQHLPGPLPSERLGRLRLQGDGRRQRLIVIGVVHHACHIISSCHTWKSPT